MIYSVNLLAVLVPLILLQYGLSLFCLVKLVFLDLPKKKFFIWNFFILLVVGIGVITFFVCYFGFRDKVFPRKTEPEQSAAEQPVPAPSATESEEDKIPSDSQNGEDCETKEK